MNSKLFLNKEIYDLKCIHMAIQAYSQLAFIKCIANECGWICTFERCVYDIDLTIKEFENYLIGMMNRRLVNADM